MVEIKTVASHFTKYKGQIRIFIDGKGCWEFHNTVEMSSTVFLICMYKDDFLDIK